MKRVFACLIFVFISCSLQAQFTTSVVKITKTYSQNGEFYIKCVPYDNIEPSLRGKSFVFDKHDKLQYVINRNFNGLRESGNYLNISNDGKTIFYAIEVYADENTDGLKSVSIYKNAVLAKSFTLTQVTGWDPQSDKSLLIYSNYDRVVDWQKSSNPEEPNYKKVFRDSVSEEEKFLNYYPEFVYNDTVYLTDSKKKVHIFDLKTAGMVRSVDFEAIYPRLKKFRISEKNDVKTIEAPSAPDKSFFPNLANGDTTGHELGKFIGMKAARVTEDDYFKYKIYLVDIEAYISRNGKIEILSLKADKHLPLERIRKFFEGHTFNVNFLPAEFDKWYFNYFFWGFRNPSDELALLEKQEADKQKRLERERRLTMDSIGHVYIPKNIEECFVQLDKTVPAVNKSEMLALENKSGMIGYHFSLGMWMRNNWGLWGGSRLLVYFTDRGFSEPDGISSMILNYYYDWVKGNKEAWKSFEDKFPVNAK